jgi:hypothetical protein
MGGIHLTLYARREIASRVKLVKFSEVACGLGNVVQNKGAVAAFLRCVLYILSTLYVTFQPASVVWQSSIHLLYSALQCCRYAKGRSRCHHIYGRAAAAGIQHVHFEAWLYQRLKLDMVLLLWYLYSSSSASHFQLRRQTSVSHCSAERARVAAVASKQAATDCSKQYGVVDTITVLK